jgi:dipeptidyl aminopeptidase/acylaminoacyl peptidase
MRQTCIAFLTSLVLALVPASGQTFSLDQYAKVARVTEPRISPDGNTVVFVVSRPNYVDDVWESEIYRVDLKSGQTGQLTQGRKTARHPRWSADGKRLAFLAGGEGKLQIFVLGLDGSEAKQITHALSGVQSFSWKPDGTAFAYLTADEAPKREKYDDAFEVEANDYLVHASLQPIHLWTIPSSGGEAHRLTSGKWSVASTSTPEWTPAGDRIAFVTQPSPGTRDSDKRNIQVIAAAGGTPEPFHGAAEQLCWLQSYSPDGKWLAMACPVDGHAKNQTEVRVAAAAGGDWKRPSATIDRNIARVSWSADSRSLVAATADGTGSALWTMFMSGEAQRWKVGKISLSPDLDIARDGRVVAIGTEAGRPPEVYLIAAPGKEPQRLTDLHAEIAAMKLGRVESILWKNDSMPFSGVVTYPPDFDESKKYPLVLLIHGGPWGSSREIFSERSQLFAGHGWIVFEPNYRGSDNYGNAEFSAVYRDHGAGPGRDLMAGLEILKKRNYVDTTRIGVSGWSYGGYMTTWLIGHYTGWKAAMAGAAVIQLDDDYNLNDLRLYIRAFGPTLSMPKDLELMKEQSPIAAVDNMKTPMLMISDAGDFRVPVTQSYKLFNALKERGQDVRMIVYPVPGHSPADPYRARDIDKRWAEWFADRLK